ncbi:MAG: isoleucine--tRNA ligase [bacterium]
MSFKKVDPKQSFPKMEEEILKFWQQEKIFEKSLKLREGSQEYSFYDGPPFATGTPHYGHLVGSTMKDVVPRYWTMRGFHVERKWGWDCHGLPIENIVEKELGSKSKNDIEKLGVEKFNDLCRSKVLKYVDDWKIVINRMGRWADMDNAYKTMDLPYMESVWWVFKELWDKGLIYEGYRSMHVCPRCETTLSQQEVSEGYMDVKDLSVIAKFEFLGEPGVCVLAWTTTPWTLIGNVALAVNAEITYVYVQETKALENGDFVDETFVVAKDRVADLFKDRKVEITNEVLGSELVGKKYKPVFDFYNKSEIENFENGWKIVAGDFVGASDGTGIVHIAPAFGEDDLNLGKEHKLPFIQHVGMNGKIKKEAGDFAGLSVKPIEDRSSTDVEIIKYLAKNGTLFAKEKYEHSYPHCWRCDTPLMSYATSSWFVKVSKIKDEALDLAKQIHWSPENIKEGRFGKWLEGARDWSISRQRFWASAIPIWRCDCSATKVFGSVAELEVASGQKITDLHKHMVDEIIIDCDACNGKMHRVPDVLDTWFDSGSMPYAQMHYPFENNEKFEQNFPADFIAEGVDQTRAWFYYLHIIATGIKGGTAYKNVIVNGTVLAEDGKKMSKRYNNYPDPMLMFDKYGADSIRLYLMSSPVVAAQNLNFSQKDVEEIMRGMMRMLWNSYSFFVLYANIDNWKHDEQFKHSDTTNLLDKWILSELNTLIIAVHDGMEKYELHRSSRAFSKFIDDMSNWYVRRSRKRFWKSQNDADKKQAYATLHHVLVNLSKMMAPFAPFMSEEIYRNLTGKESVHLADLPTGEHQHIDESLNDEMKMAREVITEGLQLRSQAKIKVRQPLAKISIKNEFQDELIEIIKDELNIKVVVMNDSQSENVILDTELSAELIKEGIAREIVRSVQELRKQAGYEVENRIKLWYVGMEGVFEQFSEIIKAEILADDVINSTNNEADIMKEISIDGSLIIIALKKI